MLGIELVRQLVVHADRALNDLREEGHEQRELADVALGGHFFAVDVEHVAHGLERVKRDAQRQQQPDVAERDRQPHGRKERLHGLGKEVIVFEHGEDAEVQQQDGDHERLAAGLAALFVRLTLLALPVLLVRGDGLLHVRGHSVHAAGAEVGRERRHDDKAHVAQAHERVKRVAADQQHHPLKPLRHEVVQHQQREYQQVKRQRCQRHASSSGVRQVLSASVANRSRTSVKFLSRYSATRGMSRDRNTATPSVTEYAPQRPRAITSPTRSGGSCASRTSTSAVVHRLPQSIHGSARVRALAQKRQRRGLHAHELAVILHLVHAAVAYGVVHAEVALGVGHAGEKRAAGRSEKAAHLDRERVLFPEGADVRRRRVEQRAVARLGVVAEALGIQPGAVFHVLRREAVACRAAS